MCVINGASLFTSNIAYMMAAYIQRKSTAVQGLYVIWLSYFMNFAGMIAVVELRQSTAVQVELTLSQPHDARLANKVVRLRCSAVLSVRYAAAFTWISCCRRYVYVFCLVAVADCCG
jgi:formate/nitrite transporter FocA (FNT family)